MFKSKKIKFLKKNKKKLNFIKVRFVTLKKVLTFKKSKFFKLRKIPQKIFFSNKWTLNMYPKFITKNLLLSSNNEKIIYQNLYKTLSSWNNQELNYNYNKQLGKNKDFYFKKGYVSKFNSFFIKKGKKLTSFNRVMSSFSIFLNDSLDFLISEEYLKSSITIFFEFLNDSTSNININKILCWMADISGFIYFFKTKALPKFLKKKLKKKYTTEPFFINSSLRYRYTLKYFYFFIENSDFSKLESRILSNVCSLAYENEESSFFDLRNKALKKAVLRAFKKKNNKNNFMLLVLAVKTLVLGLCMLPISAAALGVGILFAGYNIAVSRNPDESETIFNGTLMGFALVETFVFMSFFFGIIVYFI